MDQLRNLLGIFVTAIAMMLVFPASSQTLRQSSPQVALAKFATHLFSEVQKSMPHQNIVMSPFGIENALSILLMGAAGTTYDKMHRALKLGSSNSSEYIAELAAESQAYESLPGHPLSIASTVFFDETLFLKKKFRDEIKLFLNVNLQHINFQAGEEAAKIINRFCSEHTNGMIKDVVTKDDFRWTVASKPAAVIVNAIHFKDKWAVEFRKAVTNKFSVVKSGNVSKVDVQMMHTIGEFEYGYHKELDAKILVLPYTTHRKPTGFGPNATVTGFEMHIILPSEVTGVMETLNKLKAMKDLGHEISKTVHKTDVVVGLPKFKQEVRIELKDVLSKDTFTGLPNTANAVARVHRMAGTIPFVVPVNAAKMGLSDIFSSEKANFKGISDNIGIRVNHVLQKAVITVDEKGTEAAAATAVFIPQPRPMVVIPPVRFFVDRPFIFFISPRGRSMVPIFQGVVTNPSF